MGDCGRLTEERESEEAIPDDNDGFMTAVAEIKEEARARVVAAILSSK